MKLRRLEEWDAELMLEWMHDERVNCFFYHNFKDKTKEEVLFFIEQAQRMFDEGSAYHFAICDDDDTYLGTVSLKNVNYESSDAEYAIALRYSVQGRGVGSFATRSVLDYAFFELGLESVYLNVLLDNYGAIRLYEKCGFVPDENTAVNTPGNKLCWYRCYKKEIRNG